MNLKSSKQLKDDPIHNTTENLYFYDRFQKRILFEIIKKYFNLKNIKMNSLIKSKQKKSQ
jgi:hypothetical protein